MHRFVIVSGCSGGGKSTLLEELRRRGHAVVEEPGRRIVREEQAGAGRALPWVDAEAFCHRAIAMALDDRAGAQANPGWTFFDRGLIDALSALTHLTGAPTLTDLGQIHRDHPKVFLTPPWLDIYENDTERRHDPAEAEQEYSRLLRDYPALGYEVIVLPRISVSERADFLLAELEK